ncbi:unnamed protein product [Caenorhabditis brenneri]
MIVLSALWSYISSKRIGLVTKTPVIVFPDNDFKLSESREGVRFLYGYTENMRRDNMLKTSLSKKLCELVKNVLDCDYIPGDTRVIMVKMGGFFYGNRPHEFEPKDGAAPGSHFTYQMFGDNRIQATYYVEDGISYLAGFCFYIENPLDFKFVYRRETLKYLMDLPEYKCTRPVVLRPERAVIGNIPTEQWDVKYCGKLRRDVMTMRSGGGVYHKEWIQVQNRMNTHKCTGCSVSIDEDLPPRYSSLAMV